MHESPGILPIEFAKINRCEREFWNLWDVEVTDLLKKRSRNVRQILTWLAHVGLALVSATINLYRLSNYYGSSLFQGCYERDAY